MDHLDLNPVIHSLRTTPEDFDLKGAWLRHNPSRHCFRFESDDSVTMLTSCDCKLLMIKPEQAREFAHAFREWQGGYWRAQLINREFAAHFRHRSWLRRALIRWLGALQLRLAQQRDDLYPVEARAALQ